MDLLGINMTMWDKNGDIPDIAMFWDRTHTHTHIYIISCGNLNHGYDIDGP